MDQKPGVSIRFAATPFLNTVLVCIVDTLNSSLNTNNNL